MNAVARRPAEPDAHVAAANSHEADPGGRGVNDFPADFERIAIAAGQALRDGFAAVFPHAGLRVAWTCAASACVVSLAPGSDELKRDPLRGDPSATVSLGAWPWAAGIEWSAIAEGCDGTPLEVERAVLRAALRNQAPPEAAPPGEAAVGPFRPGALAIWRRGRRPQELPELWPTALRRASWALVVATLCSPALLVLPLPDTVRCEGRVLAAARHDIVAPFAGTVRRVQVRAGTNVARDTPTFVLLGHDAVAAAAETVTDYQESVSARLQDGAVNSDGAQLRARRAAVHALSGRRLAAGTAGRLADVAVTEGDAVLAGQRLATIFAPGRRTLVELSLSPDVARRARPGARLSLQVEDDPKRRVTARLVTVATLARTQDAAAPSHVAAIAEVVSGARSAPLAGARVTAELSLGSRRLIDRLLGDGA